MRVNRDLLTRLTARLSSLRLATALILLLIIACALGGLIPQSPVTPNAEAIYRSCGLFGYRLITRLQLDDVFGCAWFFALIGAFALNLVLCTGRRLRLSVRQVFGRSHVSMPVGEASQTVTFSARRPSADLEEPIRKAIRRVGFRSINRKDTADGGVWLAGCRWRWGALGADIVHVGILVILLGALLGIFREEGSFRIDEWQTGVRFPACGDADDSDCVPLPYDVQVNDFGIETYDQTTRVKDYWADVVLWKGEEAIERARLSVNRPLSMGGTGLYVWRYGENASGALVRLQVVDAARDIVTSEIELRVGETAPIPGSQARVTVIRFFQSYALGEAGDPIELGNATGGHPAVLLQVEGVAEDGDVIAYQDVAFPFLPERPADARIAFLLSDAQLPTFIDLHVTRNPGYPFFWWGFVLVMAGLAVAFYLRPSTLRVAIKADHLQITAHGRGSARRAERLARDIIAILGLDSQQEADR